MTMMIWIWVGVLVLCTLAEIVSLGLTTIWFAGGALIALLLAFIHAPIWLQVVLFFIVSIVLLVFTRPIAVKYFNKDRERTNAESIVGKQAIVVAEINNLLGTGNVTVDGQEWSARNADDTAVIPEGTVVEVVSISGVKLIVKQNATA